MKRLWIFLIALGLLSAAPLFADVMWSGEFMGFLGGDFTDAWSQKFPKIEFNGAAEIDDFNTLKFEFDVEGSDWSGYEDDPSGGDFTFTDEDGDTIAIAARNVALDDIRLVTDFGAALGLPFGLKTTVGYFDTYFTGWYYYDSVGWTWYYDWPNQLVYQGPSSAGAVQVDVEFDPVNLHLYMNGEASAYMVGLDAAFAGLSAWLAYGFSAIDAIGEGGLAIEAAYNIMDMADVGVFFRYDLDASEWTGGLNVGASFGMIHAALGVEADSESSSTLDNGVFEVSLNPVEPAKIAVAAFLDLGEDSVAGESFGGLDVSASYMVGAAKFALGYAYAPEGGTVVVYPSGDNFAVNGLYFGVDVDF
jgi:hypothetical protein